MLLSHARRDSDILREPNAKGDTPLDIAAALHDKAVLWALQDGDRRRRRQHSGSGDTSLMLQSRRGGEGGEGAAVDVQRIMAVWERFFENAAAACVGDSDSGCDGDGDSVQAPSSFSMYQQVHDSNDRRHSSGGGRPRVLNVVEEARRGGHDVCHLTNLADDSLGQLNDQPTEARVITRDAGVMANERVHGGRAPNKSRDSSGDGNRGWSEETANDQRRGVRIDLQLSHLPPDSPAVVRIPRFCAWEKKNKSMDPVVDQQCDDFDGVPLQALTPRRQIEKELHVQLESEAPLLSSDDDDLHLFHTPRGGDNAEAAWLPTNHEGALQYTLLKTPPSVIETSGAEENPASNALHHHQAWVACWDDSSQSIYYWNSNSGELTWAEPAAMTALAEGGDLDRFPSRVWDPQREAFFTINQDGVSHWLVDPPSSPASTTNLAERRAPGDGTGSSVTCSAQGAIYDRADVSSKTWYTCASGQQGSLGAAAAAAERSLLRDTEVFRDTVPAVGDGEEEGSTKRTLLSKAETDPDDKGVLLTPFSVTSDAYCRKDIDGFFEPEEPSYCDLAPSVPQAGAGQECEAELLDDAREYCGAASACSSATSVETTANAEEGKAADGLNFFVSTTCDNCPKSKDESEQEFCRRRASSTTINMALPLLSAWVLWCSTPSRNDDGTPPYFVNEETCTSSWVLPPEAVVESRGWLRAWSEEHQAWYYANHWTGRVTWDLQDLETER